jgi:hypothetical protein
VEREGRPVLDLCGGGISAPPSRDVSGVTARRAGNAARDSLVSAPVATLVLDRSAEEISPDGRTAG